MTTTELITALRDLAYECEDPPRTRLINEAADRLEELDERVAIMMEGSQITMTELMDTESPRHGV